MSDELASLKAAHRIEVRRKNREQAPALADLMDEMRALYPAFDVKLIYGEDHTTGAVVGTKPDERNAFTIPANYFPNQQIDTKRKANR